MTFNNYPFHLLKIFSGPLSKNVAYTYLQLLTYTLCLDSNLTSMTMALYKSFTYLITRISNTIQSVQGADRHIFANLCNILNTGPHIWAIILCGHWKSYVGYNFY